MIVLAADVMQILTFLTPLHLSVCSMPYVLVSQNPLTILYDLSFINVPSTLFVDGLGCCAYSKFSCCPDNQTPAQVNSIFHKNHSFHIA